MLPIVCKRSSIATSVGAILAIPLLVWLAIRLDVESSPAARGADLAYMQNCIECHGRADASGVPDEKLGCPVRRRANVKPHYQGSCSDLLAYFEIVRLNRNFAQRLSTAVPNRLLQGESLVREYGCFQCHGDLGQGGFRNKGALKGYIPGYFGEDFKILTRDAAAESITAWIRHGVDPSLFDFGLTGYFARTFLNRQAVKMPQFRFLPQDEIRILTEYLIALHEYGEMDASDLRDYGRRTVSPSDNTVADRRSASLPRSFRIPTIQ